MARAKKVSIVNEPESSVHSSDLLAGAVGPCSNPVQRVHNLYICNSANSSVRGRLRRLIDTCRACGDTPDWVLNEMARLADEMKCVASIEANTLISDKPRNPE